MTLRPILLAPGDLNALAAVLAACDLPTDDLAEAGRLFWRFEDDAGVVGYGGIEGDGNDRLLRSLAVVPDRRRKGHGANILATIEQSAIELGVARLHLLTTGAAGLFLAAGYEPSDRSMAPTNIGASRQFASLCPASAAYLTKELSRS